MSRLILSVTSREVSTSSSFTVSVLTYARSSDRKSAAIKNAAMSVIAPPADVRVANSELTRGCMSMRRKRAPTPPPAIAAEGAPTAALRPGRPAARRPLRLAYALWRRGLLRVCRPRLPSSPAPARRAAKRPHSAPATLLVFNITRAHGSHTCAGRNACGVFRPHAKPTLRKVCFCARSRRRCGRGCCLCHSPLAGRLRGCPRLQAPLRAAAAAAAAEVAVVVLDRGLRGRARALGPPPWA